MTDEMPAKDPENNIPVDDGIPESGHAKIPGWLKFVYFILPIWGILWYFLFWNGSAGWLDRGHWKQLEEAANTTYSSKKDQPEKTSEP